MRKKHVGAISSLGLTLYAEVEYSKMLEERLAVVGFEIGIVKQILHFINYVSCPCSQPTTTHHADSQFSLTAK